MAAARRSRRRENTPDHATPARGSRGRWAPGVSPNPGGRPKVIADIRDLAREHSRTAIQALVDIAERGEHEAARVSAATALLDRGWGRPTQPLAGDDDMPAIGISVADRDAEIARRQAEARAVIDAAFGEGVGE